MDMIAKTDVTPSGVSVIAALTLVASLALGFLDLLLWVVNFAVGGMGFAAAGESVPFTLRNSYVVFPLLFALTGFSVAIMLLMGMRSKSIWYAAVGLWIALLAFFLWYDFGLWRNVGLTYTGDGGSSWELTAPWQYATIAASILPLAYSAASLLYFQKVTVKRYFRLK
jgi:hypothetical protein